MASSFHKMFPLVSLFTAWIAIGHLGGFEAQQTGEKIVDADDIEHINDAVLISNISVTGKTIDCGLFVKPPAVVERVTPFRAGDDWLQRMAISLINRTNETIVFGSLIFHFLDTGDCHALPCVGVALTFGKRPPADAYDGRTGQPLKLAHPERLPLKWEPQQTIVIHIGDYMSDIERALADSMPAIDITNLKIYRGAFYFDDGMRWNLGRYSIPDPDHHGKFKELPADYFPGCEATTGLRAIPNNVWPQG